jgi:hypothetical protein
MGGFARAIGESSAIAHPPRLPLGFTARSGYEFYGNENCLIMA